MTTHPLPAHPAAPLRLSSPGELLASLPALLGFHPTRSLVLLCLHGARGDQLGLVARVDLPPPGAGAARDLADHLAGLCAQQDAPAALLVVVEDRMPARGVPGRRLVRAVTRALATAGTVVVAAHHVRVVEPGARWSGYDGRSGVVPDPRSSAVAAEHVLLGRVIHRSRSELEQVLAPLPADRTAPVARALDGLPRGADPSVQLAAVLAAVQEVAGGCRSAGHPDPERVAELAAALSVPAVRDACFALAGGPDVVAAEQLWTELVRAVPGPRRSEPAVLLAHSCYARGDGALAGVALALALRSSPGHRMASLLDAGLQGGLPPAAVRALSVTARDLAAELGVQLDEPRWEAP